MSCIDRQPVLLEYLIAGISATQDVSEIIKYIRSAYDLSHVTYHMVRTPAEAADSPYVRTTYPIEWVGEYLIRGYVDKDPVILAGVRRTAPYDWECLSSEAHYDEIMDAAYAFGISRCGFSVPIVDKRGRRALMSFNSRLPSNDWQDCLLLYGKDWVELSYHVHRAAVFEAYGKNDPLPKLSPRELECLTWTAKGKEAKEIAIILRLSEFTVRTYLKSVRHKLDCGTLSQAVSKAMKYRLINL